MILGWPITLQLHIDITTYFPGAYLQRHTDLRSPLSGIEYRLAIILKKAKRGGELLSDAFVFNTPRVKIFNTSVEHEVTKIEEGIRRVMLVGVYISKKSGALR